MHFIYKITNLINNKIYIGQTNNPNLRWSQHKSSAKYNRGNQIITKSISKHGADNFIFEVIATCLTLSDANESEEIIIKQYDSCNILIGYNIDAGGNALPRKPDVSLKISLSLQKYYSENNNWNKGKNLTKEWKDKISKSHIGLIGTNIGKKFSEEWKEKMSKAKKGKIFSEKHKENLSKSHKGNIPPNRKLTFEIANNIREEYSLGGITQKQLGIKYKLSQDTIFNIVNMYTYLK